MPYPFKFRPIFKQRIWGGRRLGELFETLRNPPLPPDAPVGEVWQLSGLSGDESVVANGPWAGSKLTDLIERLGADLLGHAELADGQFPLLVKLLDARQPLSVQVHPKDAPDRTPGQAAPRPPRPGARFKDECWYVIDAEPNARIWIGLKDGVDRAEFAAAADSGQVDRLLHAEPARPGHAFFLPGGTVHALGGGLVVAEVQTPSDTTYRVFDWNRVDAATGRARELHVGDALDVIDYSGPPPQPKRSHLGGVFTTVTQLVRCRHFTVERVQFLEGVEQEVPYAEMVAWQVLSGRGQVRYGERGESVDFAAGELVLLPAALKSARVFCHTDCTWLEITVPTRVPAGG